MALVLKPRSPQWKSPLRLEKNTAYETQERIADPAMERGHGSTLYAAFEPVPHNKIVSFSQLSYEPIEPRKIIGIIGVTHDHETPFRCFNAASKGRSIAAFRNRYDSRAETLRNGLGIVSRAIVGDQYLAADVRL
jgi:hypothetical protein